mgnify:CR=1 FL=1
MTSNKKKALAAGGVGIVLAGWLGASIHAGSVAERELRAFAARPSSETGVRVRNLQHSGGLFASKGSFGLEIVDQCGDGPPAALELEYSLAHLILPTHRMLDAAQEAAKGSARIGTTGKGIGPTYTDKVSRTGMRVGDVLGPEFRAVYDRVKARHEATLRSLGYVYDIAELERQWFDAVEYLKEFRLIDSEYEINRLLAEGQPVLAEGAQGTLLDIDFGSYPFVTSSNTVCAGACTGLGIAPSRIGEVFGIFKAYCTRVGAGPFPTELFDETGARLRDLGHEYGAVTGRERRCGWLDMVALKYAIMIDGVTQLIMMKSDVMNDFDTIRVATAYEIGGERTDRFPYAVDAPIAPVYKEFKGWKCDLRKFRRYEDFPAEFKAYVEFIERETGVPVRIISVGPDRDETIVR